jgi:glycosyltransferase involved in cell wall biosynthesis
MHKILYCENNVDGTIGGSYYSLFYLVTNLDRDKYQPVVVFYRDNEFVSRLKTKGIEAYVLKRYEPLNFMGSIDKESNGYIIRQIFARPAQKIVNISKRLFLSAFEKAWFLKKNKISLVHLNNSILYNHDWMLAARITGIKCISHERGINERFPVLARYFGRNLQAIICISKAVHENLYKKTDLTNALIIHNGLDPADMKVTIANEEIRKEYRIDQNAPVMGIVGNIKPWKGQDVAVKALALLKQRFEGVKCFFVGATSQDDMPFAEEVHKLVKDLHLEDVVKFTGFQRNVANFIKAMDVVVHASVLPEPFGRVILEPMALRKPVIATNIGAPPEIIVNGKTGFLVPPGDPVSLSEAISAIFEDKLRAKSMGEAGYARLVDNFSLAKNVSETTALYERLLG